MNLKTGPLKDKLDGFSHGIRRYAPALFVLFLLGIYGFLGWRIVSLHEQEPDQSVVLAELKTAGVPNIDQDALEKIRQLEDNSVSVQTLFNEARGNPFQE